MRGHQMLPHTADLVIEAWGDTREQCFEESVMGLVESFASGFEDAASPRSVPLSFPSTDDKELLSLLLDEVIYVVELLGAVPVGIELSETEDGGVAGFLETAPVGQLEIVGSLPKGVSHHELAVEHNENGWRCHVIVDV